MKFILIRSLVFTLLVSFFCTQQDLSAQEGNVILIIADDLGVDAINGFDIPGRKPNTPVLDSLRESGIAFTDAWAAPQCTPTRAAIMSGKYGKKTGVMRPPGNLDLEHSSVFTTLKDSIITSINTAVIGKWHISNPVDFDHPQQHNIDHYEGVFNASVADYYAWDKVENGVQSQEDQYVTSHFTDAAIDWVKQQDDPWLLWLAHVAPHSPYHIPPADLHTVTNTGSNYGKYSAAIEAMDTEIGRLLRELPADQLEKTTIIFIGDNGTPGNVIREFPSDHAKSTIYEGGIRVPFFICGNQVDQVGVVDDQLVQVTDIHATVLELFDVQLQGGLNNSLSLFPLLQSDYELPRWFNYVDYQNGSEEEFAIRDQQYKYLSLQGNVEEFYDVENDILEANNLINNLTPDQMVILDSLKKEALVIREGWSCSDGIQNGDEKGIDQGCLTTNLDDESIKWEHISIYPNPNHGTFRIESRVQCIDKAIIETISGTRTTETVDSEGWVTTTLNSGIYFVKLMCEGEVVGLEKVLIARN